MPSSYLNVDQLLKSKYYRTLAIGLAPQEFYMGKEALYIDCIPIVPVDKIQQVITNFEYLLESDPQDRQAHFYAAMGIGLRLKAHERTLQANIEPKIADADSPLSSFDYFRKALMFAPHVFIKSDITLAIAKISETMDSPDYDFTPLIRFYTTTLNVPELYKLYHKLETRQMSKIDESTIADEKSTTTVTVADIQNIIITNLRDMAHQNNQAAIAALANHYLGLYQRDNKQDDGLDALEYAARVLDSPHRLEMITLLEQLKNVTDHNIQQRTEMILASLSNKVNGSYSAQLVNGHSHITAKDYHANAEDHDQLPDTTIAIYQDLMAQGNLDAIDQLADWYMTNAKQLPTNKGQESQQVNRTLYELYCPVLEKYQDIPRRLKILGHLLQSKNAVKQQTTDMFQLLLKTLGSAFADLPRYSTQLYEIYCINSCIFTKHQLQQLFDYYMQHPTKINMTQFLSFISDNYVAKTTDDYFIRKIAVKYLQRLAKFAQLTPETVVALNELYWKYQDTFKSALVQRLLAHFILNANSKNLQMLFKFVFDTNLRQTMALLFLQIFAKLAGLKLKAKPTVQNCLDHLYNLLKHVNGEFRQGADLMLVAIASQETHPLRKQATRILITYMDKLGSALNHHDLTIRSAAQIKVQKIADQKNHPLQVSALAMMLYTKRRQPLAKLHSSFSPGYVARKPVVDRQNLAANELNCATADRPRTPTYE